MVVQCIFEPRVIEFDRKRMGTRVISNSEVTEEIIEHATDRVVSLEVFRSQYIFMTVNRLRQ
jgi:actin-related protein 8